MNISALISDLIAFGTFIAQFAAVGVLSVAIVTPRSPFAKKLGERALLFSFIVSLAATLGSLFYSEIAGFVPCNFCWWQRIFMYPIAIMTGMALITKDHGVLRYAKTLAIAGGAIALYQHLLQLGLVPSAFCSASAVSCSQRFVFEMGYITLPFMSFIAFALIAVFAVLHEKNAPRRITPDYAKHGILRESPKVATHPHLYMHIVAFTLLVIGGLNWLVLALFGWDIGQLFGGMDAAVSKIVYVLVGLSALYEVFVHKKHCKTCEAKGAQMQQPRM